MCSPHFQALPGKDIYTISKREARYRPTFVWQLSLYAVSVVMWDVTSGLLVLSECGLFYTWHEQRDFSRYFVMLGGHLREFKSAG